MDELRNIWRQLSASFGLIAGLIIAAVIVVAIVAVFGFVAIWIAVIYLGVVAYLAVRRFLRRHFGPLAGTAEQENPFEPSSKPFTQQRTYESAGEKDVETIDVTAETVEYVDPPALKADSTTENTENTEN